MVPFPDDEKGDQGQHVLIKSEHEDSYLEEMIEMDVDFQNEQHIASVHCVSGPKTYTASHVADDEYTLSPAVLV